MLGYLNAKEKTDECLCDQGWLRTGDVAIIDDDGYVTITDRIKELIKYKGFQVAPAELEGLLLTSPDIVDACVIPVPDDEAGEVPRAYVVVRSEAKGKVSEQDVLDYVAARAASHKHLRGGVVMCDSIPKTESGKILRRLVIAMDREATKSPAAKL
mmetsp:Transcript_6098/g.17045  ORF Transcript_6098/g.17045 Transcript_6098/m.17045 type:complete len:156 (-) Transcript_6098:92-559(-)